MVDRFIDVLKKKGVNQYELYYSESYIEPVKFDQNVLQSLEVKSEKGLGIRVIPVSYTHLTLPTKRIV